MFATESAARPVSAVLACALALAACGSSRHRESERERARSEPVESSEPGWPAVTVEQLGAFTDLLSRGYKPDVLPLRELSSAVRIGPIVLQGELISVEAGRKEFVFRGCDVPSPEGSGGPCLGNPKASIYASYVNLGIRPQQIWKGSLPDPEDEVFVERPHNVPLDELTQSAPFGARVLVFGQLVPNARELAEPLEADGLEVSVERNLLNVPPYGLMVESIEGGVIVLLARYETQHARFVEGLTFDEVIEMIDNAIRQL